MSIQHKHQEICVSIQTSRKNTQGSFGIISLNPQVIQTEKPIQHSHKIPMRQLSGHQKIMSYNKVDQ